MRTTLLMDEIRQILATLLLRHFFVRFSEIQVSLLLPCGMRHDDLHLPNPDF